MDDPSLDDDGSLAEGEPEVVQGIEVERKRRFNLRTATADLLDRHRLEGHDLALEVAEDFDPLRIAAIVVGFRHPSATIARVAV
jgi:hypothetical protein